jgi:hypothetical protein
MLYVHSVRCTSSLRRCYSRIRQRVGPDLYEVFRVSSGRVLKEEEDKHTLISAKRIKVNLQHVFLPKGYPASVAHGYDGFVAWSMIGSVSGTVCGVLSMQSLLLAIGVGSAASFPLAATLNWIVKDGLGQLGGILFAGMVNNRFDAHPKFFRMLASIAMEASSLIELLLPLAPELFLVGASFANMGKNVSFLAASASRAAIHRSFAVHGNLADVTAKSGSQAIVCSLVGTSIGISLATAIHNEYMYTLGVFGVCAVMSMSATYLSLRTVTLSSLTSDKLDHVLDHYLESKGIVLLGPQQLHLRERLLRVPPIGILAPLHVNRPVDEALGGYDNSQVLPQVVDSTLSLL